MQFWHSTYKWQLVEEKWQKVRPENLPTNLKKPSLEKANSTLSYLPSKIQLNKLMSDSQTDGQIKIFIK